MLIGVLGASLLGNILAGKGAIVKPVSEETKTRSQWRGVNRAGEGTKRVSKETKSKSQGRRIIRVDYGNKTVQKTTTKNKNNF